MTQQLISAIKKKPVYADGDGYYGTPPSDECIETALKFVGSLPKYYQDVLNPGEHVTTLAHGTIVVDWYYRRQFVSVEIGNTLVGFYSDFADGMNPESAGAKPESARTMVLGALNKLYGRKDA